MDKIILDTDPGIDDAQAIAYAIAHPKLELIGLTTVFGNASVDVTTPNAVWLLEKFGQPDTPVAKGAGKPLVQDLLPPADFVHGQDGLGNLNLAPPIGKPVNLSAAEFIVSQASADPGSITLVAVGPLTNIAEAVALDPGLPGKVKELVIMGGTVDEPGNVSPVAEANFLNDPHAADQVLAHDWPVTIIGLDVTHQILLRDADLARLRDSAQDIGRFLWDSSRFYVDFYSRKGAASQLDEPSCAMHDAAAVVFLTERDAFGLQSGPARVVQDGIAAGQLTLDRKRYEYAMSHWQDRPVCHAAMSVDAISVRNSFLETIIESAG